MKKMALVFWTVISIFLMAGVLPASAQSDACDPGIFNKLDALLAQAQTALDAGDFTTASVILSGIRATIAPCTGNAAGQPPAAPPTPIAHNADWTPVIQEFDGVEMVLVPAGCFQMGSDDQGDYEKPAHLQCIDAPFWIDRYEVSNALHHRTDPAWADDKLPLTQITWPVAAEVCHLRGARLPTEAEWEYAARGPDGLMFPWGNEFVPDHLVYRGSAGQTADVDSHPDGASWVGAFNMSGNVLEWTSSLFREYPYDANDGRELVTDDGSARVVRGGSFYDDEYYVSSVFRTGANTSNNNINLGVRCVRPYEG
jgi:formylglycine-generating enzyme required for sulfatase activity